MNLHGRLRSTRDIDVIVTDAPDDAIKESIQNRGFAHHPRADRHALDGVNLYRFWLPIEGIDQSMALDVQQGLTEFHRSVLERAEVLELDSLSVRVASVEDLILLKLLAFRPVDGADARELMVLHPDLDQNYLAGWAARLGIVERLDEVKERQ